MLPLLLAAIIVLFLITGSLVFLACLLLPPTRRYALSAALWCAMWGPCAVALMLLAGVGWIAAAFITQSGNSPTLHTPRLLSTFGWTYLIIGVLITTVVATLSAVIHQALIGRMTFALFRIYAALVSAGIGSVFGWALGWWMMTEVLTGSIWLLVWGFATLMFIAAFGAAAYTNAKRLRGHPPTRFTWISASEFVGP